MTQEITELSPPGAGPFTVSMGRSDHAPTSPSNLSATAQGRGSHSRDFEGHGIGKPLVPAVRRQALKVAPTSYRNLKERLESGV